MAFVAVDQYTTAPDGQSGLGSDQWLAQSFTATGSYTITAIDLNMYKVGTPTTLTIGIFATSSDKPTGAALVSASVDPTAFTTDVNGAVVNITFGAGTPLTSAVVYAIRLTSADALGANSAYMRHKNTGLYAGGKAYYSGDSGTNWTGDGPGQDADNYFVTYKTTGGVSQLTTLNAG